MSNITIQDIYGKYRYANKQLCVEWRNNIPLRELENNDYMLLTDSQDIKSICDYFPMLSYDDITGIICSIGDGDYKEVYVTEWRKPYDLNAIYHPIDYYL